MLIALVARDGQAPILSLDNIPYTHGDYVPGTGLTAYQFMRAVAVVGAKVDGQQHLDAWLETGKELYPSKVLGDKIRTMREIHEWSQTELAERIGFTQNSVSRWENGAVSPGIEALRKLSETLEVDMRWLIEE